MVFGFNTIALPAILPFLYFLSFTAFMATYAAYPIIDRYMIAPYAETIADEGEDEGEEAPSPDAK